MKKYFFILQCVFIALALVGCGGGTPNTTSAEQTTQLSSGNKAEFKEIVAVDNEYCTIKITDFDPKGTVKVTMENKSSDVAYYITTESISLNGIEIIPMFSAFVDPGQSVDGEIYLNDTGLVEIPKVEEFSDIEFNFAISKKDASFGEYLAREKFRMYPLGEENAKKYVREAVPTDKVIIDTEQFSVVVTGTGRDNYDNYTVKLYLVNKSDKHLLFVVDDALFAGVSVVPYFIESLDIDRVKFSQIAWSQSMLDQNGVKEIKDIEILLSVWDSENRANKIHEERFTLTP